MEVGDTPPLTVRVSTSEHCEPKYTSEEIPVKNRNADMAQTPPKMFGVCTHAGTSDREKLHT